MKRRIRAGVAALGALLLVAAFTPASAIDDRDATAVALDLVRAGGWPTDESALSAVAVNVEAGGRMMAFFREAVTDEIAHYAVRIRVGPDPHDVIGLHRVVRERRPGKPIRTAKTIFLQHGDAKDFQGMFLPGTLSPSTPDDFGLAVFLAENDVDVWGIDQGWTLVPEETTDFGFMESWGLQRQVDDLRIAMSVARLARFLTHNGYHPMLLLGYSSGGVTGYSTLNHEAVLPPWRRHVSGFVCADMSPKTDDDPWRIGAFCDYVQPFRDRIAAGEYQEFIPFALIAELARTAPDDPSPLIPGFTNFQAAMFFGAGPIFGVGAVHYWAGVWSGGLPVDFQFVTIDQAFDFMAAGVPWEALRFMLDYSVLGCGEEDSPFDDNYALIEVPILNLAAGGGVGAYSYYTTTLVGSTDITHVIVSTDPDWLLDFGHIDLFTAYNAPDLAWQPLLDWIVAHTGMAPRAFEADAVPAEAPELRVEPNPGGQQPYEFSFAMPSEGRASLEIFDVAGRRIAAPLDGELTAGATHVVWNGTTADGGRLAQGVYFARVTTPERSATVKFVHLAR